MRTPTREEKAKEAAVLYTSLADLAIFMVQLVCALTTLSLTLLSEAIRVGLMLAIEFYSLFLLRAIHRDRLRKFRFGIGKVEQMCNLAIGAALLFSGFWVANHVLDTLLVTHEAATPLGLATAAVVSAINLLINALGWLAMVAAAGKDDSAIFQAQLRARTVKLVSSVIVQATITVAAVSRDPVISAWMDGIGATFVAVVMIVIAFKMVMACLPDLLDHPVPQATKEKVETGLLSAGITREELVRIRTRRAGSIPQVELTLSPAGQASLVDYSSRAAEVENRLKAHLRGADVSVVVDASES